MVHYLDIFHSEHLHPLLHDLRSVSLAAVVNLQEIGVITIEPSPFSTVYLDYLCVELVDFFL